MKAANDFSVLIIAEVSANHGQNFKHAVEMIRVAKECGADAVKFQAYTPDNLTLDCDNEYFQVKHKKWGGQTLYELYKKAYTPLEWLPELKKIADNEGITFFATAFDKETVDLLEKIDVPYHKIASFELVDLPLIEYAASTKKPLIISTGMGTVEEIEEAVRTANNAGAKEVVLLKCVSSYPAVPEEMNLITIPDMGQRFGCQIGLSDHSEGIVAPITAVALGAVMIEKHFCLSKDIETPDSFFSIEPAELRELASGVRIAEKALGEVSYGAVDKESKAFRRSLFVVKDIEEGEVFTKDNIRSVRPGCGMHPKYYGSVIGKYADADIKSGTPLSETHISNSLSE